MKKLVLALIFVLGSLSSTPKAQAAAAVEYVLILAAVGINIDAGTQQNIHESLMEIGIGRPAAHARLVERLDRMADQGNYEGLAALLLAIPDMR